MDVGTGLEQVAAALSIYETRHGRAATASRLLGAGVDLSSQDGPATTTPAGADRARWAAEGLHAVEERVGRGRTALGPLREAVAARAAVVGKHIDRARRAALDDLGLDAVPCSGPSSNAAVMVGPASWPEPRASDVTWLRRVCAMAIWPRGPCGLAGPGDVRQRCGDLAAVGVQPLGEVAGRAQRVLVQVLDDALLDVVLVQSRRGATVAGATGGRSTRRTLRHHWRCDERRSGGVGWALRPRCDAVALLKTSRPSWRCRARGRGNETQRVSRSARPCGSRSWPRAPLLGAVALRWLSGPRLKSCPQGRPPPTVLPSGPVLGV